MRWLLLVLLPCLAQGAPTPVPQPVAQHVQAISDALAQGDHARAVTLSAGWTGAQHPLVHLVRGHALSAADKTDAAVAAYEAALRADPTLKPAAMGLINTLARADRWDAVRPLVARWIDPARANSSGVRLLLSAALETGDRPLAEAVARQGMLRFPDAVQFRRGLAHVLVEAGRGREAESHLRWLLRAAPADPVLWQQLAYTRQRRDAPTRAALEAAVLSAPDDPALRQRLLAAQLSAGQHAAAIAHAEILMAGQPTPRQVELSVQAAVDNGAWDRAQRWIARAPGLTRLAVRIALATGDLKAARAGLGQLLRGEPDDGPVLLQLAVLERRAGALNRAEALLRQAAALPDPTRRIADVQLANLLAHRGRAAEAVARLRAHLGRHPGDATARRLLDAIQARGAR